ncbi:MAG TPA: uridine diphosphate-N-acetylglucosamine-binding protein YvcK [Blastocatellia bacterium]|nr:uridine diphosphate-N-acetylglucosamine-binding protein YvcK [Blastocatellia bacterium]
MSGERNRGLNVVSIGGGTGLSTLLSGLKHHVAKESPPTDRSGLPWIDTLTAVVTVTDDGGSSGRLREEFQILPPGDIRNCMVALAEDEALLTKLFQYRFESDGDLSGHSFGNLFVLALAGVTGDFLEAIKVTSEVLAIKGRIFPSTTEDVALVAQLEDGRIIQGETRIVESRSRIKRLWLSREHCKPLPETLEAIKHADIITVGPGSIFTSILPNLLVDGIVEAIRDSDAVRFLVCNLMTQPGESEDFSVEDHLQALFDYRPDLELDYVLVNTAPVSAALRDRYRADGAISVAFRTEQYFPPEGHDAAFRTVQLGFPRVRAICSSLLSEHEVVRHDPQKLTRLLLDVYCMCRNTAGSNRLIDS